MRIWGGGRIVNISSIGGKIAVPHLASYSASKFALTGLSDAVRAELARDNIHVTTVAPGMMRTGSHVNAKFKGKHDKRVCLVRGFCWSAASFHERQSRCEKNSRGLPSWSAIAHTHICCACGYSLGTRFSQISPVTRCSWRTASSRNRAVRKAISRALVPKCAVQFPLG